MLDWKYQKDIRIKLTKITLKLDIVLALYLLMIENWEYCWCFTNKPTQYTKQPRKRENLEVSDTNMCVSLINRNVQELSALRVLYCLQTVRIFVTQFSGSLWYYKQGKKKTIILHKNYGAHIIVNFIMIIDFSTEFLLSSFSLLLWLSWAFQDYGRHASYHTQSIQAHSRDVVSSNIMLSPFHISQLLF